MNLKNILLLIVISIHSAHAETNGMLLSISEDEETISTGEGEGYNEDVFDIPKIQTSNPSINKSIVESKTEECNTAKIIALNKVTAKSQDIQFNIGELKYFGNIAIKVHKCLQSTDPYLPDNKILLTITEHKIDEDPTVIFQGWLISSNLSISTFEHPVYEVFAKNCF